MVTILIIALLSLSNFISVSGEVLTSSYERNFDIGYGGSYYLTKGDLIKVEVSCKITPLPPKDGCDLSAFYAYLGSDKYFQGGTVTPVRHEFIVPQTGYYFIGVKNDHYIRLTRISSASEQETKNYTDNKITTNNTTSSNYQNLDKTGVNLPSKSFFVNEYTGKPNVLIIVGAQANAADIISANLFATEIAGIIQEDIDPTELILLDIELNTATNTKNLTLVGGPVYNSIVKDLADMGISTVDWWSSSGEWEYISDPLARGYDVLIVGVSRPEAPIITEDLISSFNVPEWYNRHATQISPEAEDAANKNKILFDANYKILRTIMYSGEDYYIVEYSNLFPFCSGVEIISESGQLVTSNSKAYTLLKQMSWEEAINLLNDSDMNKLTNIQRKSYEVSRQISPILELSDSILQTVEGIKSINILGINVGNIGWQYLESNYPSLKIMLQGLEKLSSYLGEWKGILDNNYNSLNSVIGGISKLRSGDGLDPTLESSINNSVSNLESLKSKSNELKGYISDIREGVKFINVLELGPLQELYGYLGKIMSDINTLNNDISIEISKLTEIVNKANQREAQLKSSWDSRRGAQEKTYIILGAILILFILFIIIISISIKKNKKEKIAEEKKKEKNIRNDKKIKLNCPKCGKEIKEDWIICPNCLQKLE